MQNNVFAKMLLPWSFLVETYACPFTLPEAFAPHFSDKRPQSSVSHTTKSNHIHLQKWSTISILES